jgi:hypothetical protein
LTALSASAPTNLAKVILTVPRHLSALLLWFALGTPASHAAAPAGANAPAAALSITYAEQPVRLVRETSMFSAGRGVVLRRDDLLASGDGAILLDTGGATIAIGPASLVYVTQVDELVLLEGWIKVQGRPGPGLRVKAPGLQLTTTGATAMLRVTPGASEVFAEAGELALDELRVGKAARRLRLPREQYAVRSGAQPVRILPRPQGAYLAAMPVSFRDGVIAVPKGAVADPKREREATFTEVSPWLMTQPGLRERVHRRFYSPKPGRVKPARSTN